MKILTLAKLDKTTAQPITLSHFRTFLNSQPYFIWAKRNVDGDIEYIPNLDTNGFKLYDLDQNNNSINNPTSHDLSIFSDFDDDDDTLEDELFNRYHSKELKLFLNSEWNYKSENTGMFSKAQKQAVDFIVANHNLTFDEIYFNSRIYPVEKLHQIGENFNEFMQNDTKKMIIDPAFVYFHKSANGINYLPKSSCFAYCKEHKSLYFFKTKDKTSLSDYQNAFFTYKIATKMNVDVKEIKFIVFDWDLNSYKKEVIPFNVIHGCNSSNSNSGVKRDGENMFKSDDELKMRGMINSGQAMEIALTSQNTIPTVFASITEGKVWKNANISDLKKYYNENKKIVIKKTSVEFDDFDEIIEKIIEARDIAQPTYSIKQGDEYVFDCTVDSISPWGKNPEIQKIKNLYLGTQYLYSTGNNGTGKSLRTSLTQQYIDEHKQIVDKLYSFPNYFTKDAIDLLKLLMIKDERIVWYDYEGVSSLVPLFDNLKSWNQIPHQVSIIVTQNGHQIHSEDILKDPKNINLIDLVDVILAVYQNKAHKYVVFNKNYENTRNWEIRDLVKKYYDNGNIEFISKMQQRGIDSWLEFNSIVKHINTNTIDLVDFFAKNAECEMFFTSNYIKHNQYHKPIFELDFINFSGSQQQYLDLCSSYKNTFFADKSLKPIRIMELLGFTSIKKLEKLITKSGYKYKNEIKEYATLEIKNGSMALELAISRANNTTKDLEWAAKSDKLKEYCHNDVVAMIVVYEFVLGLVANVFPNIYDLEYKIHPNQEIELDFENKKLFIKGTQNE